MKISIIVPVYNEEKLIRSCLDALIDQDYPKEDYEIVAVNDGSIDNTLEVIKRKQKEAKEKDVKIRIVYLKENKGRVIARETGAKNAKHNNLMFVDSRCVAEKDILKNIKEISYQPIVGNPLIDTKRSIFDRFNWLIRKKIYAPYFGEKFKPVFITKENFDKVGKGTTIFFCDKGLFLSSQLKDKKKLVSDDIKLLWNVVQKKKMLKHPNVGVTYSSRNSLKGTVEHIFQRGPKFVDYYLTPKKKYFWLFIFLPFFALTVLVIFASINLTYFLYWVGFLILFWMLVSIWLAENVKDFFIVMGFLPIFGFSFGLGILKGLILKLLRKY